MTLWPSFEFHEPKSLEDAFALLAEGGGETAVVAGGVSLALRMRLGYRPGRLVSLRLLEGLEGIADDGRCLRIGAMTNVSDLAECAMLEKRAPLLRAACANVATPRVRNMGTLGGNVAQRDPNFDPPLALIALEAEALLASRQGEIRKTQVSALYERPEELRRDEILTAFEIRPQESGGFWSYLKHFPLSHDGTTGINVAVVLSLGKGGAIETCNLVVGSVSTRPVRLRETERRLVGHVPGPEAIADATVPIADEVEWNGSDQRGSAQYLAAVVPELVRRALIQALERQPDAKQA